ncbi:MAG TPA: hypothetical protein VFT04_05460 [Gemmatimonadales bacterium]|nr:hypothetical protein [Gemmatimonadales bacterium]
MLPRDDSVASPLGDDPAYRLPLPALHSIMRPHLIVLALLAACTDPAPIPAARLVPGPDTLRLPIVEATDGAWLGGSRFALLSPADNAVAVVDLDGGTFRIIDQSSGELQHPTGLFALGDTLFISDWARRRATAWTADGSMVRSMPAVDALRGALPRAIDARGALYYEVPPLAGRDGSGNRDSAAVVRVDRAGTIDTIARLAPLDIAEVAGERGARFERRVFSGDDEWGVLPDGSLWVARTYQNRVDWIDSAGVHEGERLVDRVLEVTRTDRERFVERFPAELRASAERLPFSPIKPPFVRGFTVLPGEVWLEKSRSILDSMQLYHRVGRDGELIRELRLEGWPRTLAASDRQALIVLADSIGIRVVAGESRDVTTAGE